MTVVVVFRCCYCTRMVEEAAEDVIERIKDTIEVAIKDDRKVIPIVCSDCLVKEYPDRFERVKE